MGACVFCAREPYKMVRTRTDVWPDSANLDSYALHCLTFLLEGRCSVPDVDGRLQIP